MGKKLMLIVGAVATILMGGGAGAFLMMSGGAAAETPKPAATHEPPPPAPVFAPKGAYLKLDPMSAPLPAGPKGRRQMMVLFQLDVAAHANLPKVEALIPRIRDAFIRDLIARPVGTAEGWEQDDIELVKRRLLAQGERITGPGVLSEVLVVHAVRVGG